MKKLYSVFTIMFFTVVYSQNETVLPANISDTENYAYTREYLDATSTSSTSVKQTESVTYFDGLGRPKQVINIKASPSGKDVVTQIKYDGLGRQDKDYLPMPQQGTTIGGIYSPATTPYTETVGIPLYGGTAPFYAQKETENSPLGRPLSNTAPGAWSVSGKKSSLDYQFNSNNEVKKYTTSTDWVYGRTNSVLIQPGMYSANQLYKTLATDEDGSSAIEFKNKLGQTVMVRKVLGLMQYADTYYVYNEYQDLAYVIPPLASVKSTLSQTDLNELCYQYRYDARNRLVEKHLPGKDWEYMVYDKQDRLVMTQDANMGADKKWLFTKYDKFGRPAYTGLYISSQDYNSAGRAYEQVQVDGKGSNNVERTTSPGFTTTGLSVYYDNLSAKNYPNVFDKVLSVSYYDTYPAGTPAIPAFVLGQEVLPQNAQTSVISTKGLPTASFVNNAETNGWTKTFIWYDRKGRSTGSHTINHLGGYTKTETLLDFSGAVKEQYVYHKRKNATTSEEVTVKETFEYDDQNRLLLHKHKVNNATEEFLTRNEYNELGQLKNKQVGGTALNTPLQSVDYSYNVRGWLTGINSGDISVSAPYTLNNGKLFGYRIKYNNPENPSVAPAKYNGNISETEWISGSGQLKRYGYQYDKLNRLLAGIYQDPGLTVPESHLNDETLTYDLNGNVKTLVRNTKHGKFGTPVVIDNLTYYYNSGGNKVTSISDASGNISGYEGGNAAITYDANGNMTAIPDKGISSIAYNFLNLPKQISQHTNTTNYYYRADGVKIKKKYTLVNASGTSEIYTEYLDGFQYSTPNIEPIRRALDEQDEATLSAATAGEEEAFSALDERGVAAGPGPGEEPELILSFFPTAEGYYDYENLRYIYQYKDHLGNVRISYVKDGSNLKIMDTNEYYPFGMSFLNQTGFAPIYDPMAIPYNYKFGGKELQETGFYDFGARFYMSDIAIFGTHDPLSEKTLQPYAYAYNNPMRFMDPTGMEGEEAASSGSETGGGGVPGSTGMDVYGNQTVNIGYGVNVAAGTAAISVSGGNTQEIKNRNSAIYKLRDEFKGTSMNPDSKAKFDDHEKLTSELPTLKNLRDKTNPEFSINDNLGENTAAQQVRNTNKIEVNTTALTTKLIYAFSLGHEMLHVFDSIYNYPTIMSILGTTTLGSHAYGFYKEYRAYMWEKNMGRDNINVSAILKTYYEPQYPVEAVNKVYNNLSRLNTAAINP